MKLVFIIMNQNKKKQWSPKTNMFKAEKSAGKNKIMTTVFQDAQGVILAKGETINSEAYIETL